jgi:dihydroorotate dehydrogenase
MLLYPFLRPLIFRMEAERAHNMTVNLLERLPVKQAPPADPRLKVRLAGLDFPSPVGLAAGFDKDARVADAMLGLGFGSVEVGTVTPRPQLGNPKPRLFRLVEDHAVINRMGFNNGGQAAAAARLAARSGRGIVGINIGVNKDSTDRIADYAAGVRTMAPVASYLTVNVSSPNTPGLRALQEAAALDELLAGVLEARGDKGPPIFLKIAPDLEQADIQAIARVVVDRRLDALIVTNTTLSRPPLTSRLASESGGLSGEPLRPMALQQLKDFRRATGGEIPLIAAGGITTAEDAYERIRAGASLIQLYSALIFAGPGLARKLAKGLVSLLQRDGFANIGEAVGR